MAPDYRATWEDLEAFGVIAAELSFTRAARRLRLTQPALSRRIQRLEAQLGVALFERTTRRVTLTEAGHKLLTGSAALDAAWGRVQTDIADCAAHTDAGEKARTASDPGLPLPAELRVSAASLPAIRLLEALIDAYPATRWLHEPFDHSVSLNAVGDGDLDFVVAFHVVPSDPTRPVSPPPTGVGHLVVQGRRLPSLHLVDEPVWLATGPRTSWADHEELALAHLAGEAWIARPDGPLRQLFDDACRRAGFTATRLHIADNNWPIRNLVATGQGVTLCAATVAGEDIVVVPLLDAPRLRYALTWCPRRLTDDQAHHIHRTVVAWYRTEAQRSRRYWAHVLSHPAHFPTVHPSWTATGK